MSTVFYGYKVETQNLWEVLDRIRDYYKRVHFIYRIKVDRNEKDLEDENIRKEFLESLRNMLFKKEFADNVNVDLQLFNFDDFYIFRILESGYQFMNSGYKAVTLDYPDSIYPVFYDDRTDIPDNDLENKVLVDEIDGLVRQKHYFMVSIVESGYEIYHYYADLLSSPEGRQSMYSTNIPLPEQKE